MATTFLESGTDATEDFTFWAATAGTVTSDTSQSNTGPRSIKCATTASNLAANVTTAAGVVADAGAQISFYLRFDALPGVNNTILRINQAGGLLVFAVSLRTTGILQNFSVNGTTTLAANTWYRISVSYFITSVSSFQTRVYVNGVLDSTSNQSGGNLPRATSSLVSFGPAASYGASKNVWIDDVYIATGGASSSAQPDTPNVRVTAKRPFSNGTSNGFTTQIGAGGSGYGTGHAPQVNEQPLNTANGWSIAGAGSAITEEYNIEGATVGDVNIAGAAIVDYMGWVFTKAVLSETAQIIVNGVSSSISIPTNANTFLFAFAGSPNYPAGTGADIGETTSTTVTTVSLFECGIVFGFVPSAIEWNQPGYFEDRVSSGL